MLKLVRAVLWRRVDRAGTEYCALWEDGPGWQLRGTVVTALAGRPSQIRYAVICDERWHTRDVHIGLRAGGPEQVLHLRVEDDRWLRGEGEIEAVQGCVDVDLGVTPSTITLPIRRLDMAPGDSARLTAAWVRFPDLTVEPLEQTYTRVGAHRFRLESSNGYAADVEVDDLSLVVRSTYGWEREATTRGTS